MSQIHGTVVEVNGKGVLLRGESGVGKSDLALRLIDGGGRLVADDRCEVTVSDDRITATCPDEIFGLLEVRGIGVVRMNAVKSVHVDLVVELCRPEDVARMPDDKTCEDFGVSVPVCSIAPFESSATAKIRLIVAKIAGEVDGIS